MCLSNSQSILAAVIFLATGTSTMSAQAATFAELQARLAEAIRGGNYMPSPSAEVDRAEALFLRLAKGASPADVAAEAKDLAMKVEGTGPLVTVREEENAKQGRGFFVFRRNSRPDVLLVPHGFKDEMTRDIGVSLFSEGGFSAAAWNTVPRYYERHGVRVDADMAHLDSTWFNAFVRATARVWPEGQMLQIHGFEQGKRKSAAGAEADMVLSNSTRTPGQQLRRQAQCLAEGLGRKVLLYPEGSRELGGTTNAQAATLSGLGYQGFVHMELSRPLRQALRGDVTSRAALLRCMQQ